jgi:hypothetical protein
MAQITQTVCDHCGLTIAEDSAVINVLLSQTTKVMSVQGLMSNAAITRDYCKAACLANDAPALGQALVDQELETNKQFEVDPDAPPVKGLDVAATVDPNQPELVETNPEPTDLRSA